MHKTLVRGMGYALLGCAALCMMGCGVSEKRLKSAEDRIAALRNKGVPDSVLSTPQVLIFEVRTANKLGDGVKARKAADSALILIESAEKEAAQAVETLKPVVVSSVERIKGKRSELTGLHLRAVDSVLEIVDSLSAKSWYLQARDKVQQIETMWPELTAMEQKAKKIRPKLIGTWNRTEKSDFGGVARSRFTFKKDGGLELVEEKTGQTNEVFKESWRFLSWGTYDLMGDSIHLFISREKCEAQTYWTLVSKDGKQQWKEDKKPTYDTTITNGKKDRVMSLEYLTQFFRK